MVAIPAWSVQNFNFLYQASASSLIGDASEFQPKTITLYKPLDDLLPGPGTTVEGDDALKYKRGVVNDQHE